MRENEEENRCAPSRREHSQQTLGAQEGSGCKRHQEEHARQRGQALLDSTHSQDSPKAFSSAISHALPSTSLEVRHCQTPGFSFLPSFFFLYSTTPLAWNRKLSASCTKWKRTFHSSHSLMVLLENHVHCTFWSFNFFFQGQITITNLQLCCIQQTTKHGKQHCQYVLRSDQWNKWPNATPGPGSRLCLGKSDKEKIRQHSGCVLISRTLRSGANSSLLFTPVTSRVIEMMRSDTFLPLFFV